jgi:hypothetical protein
MWAALWTSITPRKIVATALMVVFFTLVYLIVAVPVAASGFATKAKQGDFIYSQGLRPDTFFSSDEPLLQFQSIPTQVIVMDKDASALKRLEGLNSLRYLGENSRYVVLYDYKSNKTYRIPPSSVALSNEAPKSRPISERTTTLMGGLAGVLGVVVAFLLVAPFYRDNKRNDERSQ